MANICYNAVTFYGEELALTSVNTFFDDLFAEAAKGKEIDDDIFIKYGNGYFSEPFRTDVNSIHFRTFWSPGLEVIHDIAEQFNVAYIHNYQELGMRVYGRAFYAGGQFLDVGLDWGDYNSISYDEDKDEYYHDGTSYANEYLMLDNILDEKIGQAAAELSIAPQLSTFLKR